MAIGLVAISAASTANAVPVQFDWVGSTVDGDWSASGFIVVESDTAYNRTLDVNSDLLDWMFSWTNGTSTQSISSMAGDIWDSNTARIDIDASGTIGHYRLCSNSCSLATGTLFTVGGGGTVSEVGFIGWNASDPSPFRALINSSQTGRALGITPGFTDPFELPTPTVPDIIVTVPDIVATVPNPPSLVLLGAGLIALGAVRRQKKTRLSV